MAEKVLVLGLSKSGIAVAKYLKHHGYDVYLTENKKEVDIKKVKELEQEGINVEYGAHTPKFIDNASYAITSPGIPPKAEIFKMLSERPFIGQFYYLFATITFYGFRIYKNKNLRIVILRLFYNFNQLIKSSFK